MTTESQREVLESNISTWEHIDRVRLILRVLAVELLLRGESHDRSKLHPPEATMFGEFTPKLKAMQYGSDEYKQALKDMGPALQHHYEHNRHHPEFWEIDQEWKPVGGYEGHYEVSNLGFIRSLDRVVQRPGRGDTVAKAGQLLKVNVTPKGYLRVQLVRDGAHQNFLVHRLVAQMFIPNPELKPEVNHKDGDKTNNRVANLEWVTSSENLLHAYEAGLKEPNVKYVVHCPELDITTLGVEKMERALREKGYDHARSSGIWTAMDRGEEPRRGKHLDLTFEGTLLHEWVPNRLEGMTLIDLNEMFVDWWASTLRGKDGDIGKSIEIAKSRFGLSDQLAKVFMNTVERYKGEAMVPHPTTQRVE